MYDLKCSNIEKRSYNIENRVNIFELEHGKRMNSEQKKYEFCRETDTCSLSIDNDIKRALQDRFGDFFSPLGISHAWRSFLVLGASGV